MEIEKDVDKSQIPLELLGLSSRTLHALHRVGIRTVDDVLKMLELNKRLPKFPIPNFGKKGHEELIAKLCEKGYVQQ